MYWARRHHSAKARALAVVYALRQRLHRDGSDMCGEATHVVGIPGGNQCIAECRSGRDDQRVDGVARAESQRVEENLVSASRYDASRRSLNRGFFERRKPMPATIRCDLNA